MGFAQSWAPAIQPSRYDFFTSPLKENKNKVIFTKLCFLCHSQHEPTAAVNVFGKSNNVMKPTGNIKIVTDNHARTWSTHFATT